MKKKNKSRTRYRTKGDIQKVIELRKAGRSYRDITDLTGIPTTSAYDICRKYMFDKNSSGSFEQDTTFEAHNIQISNDIIEKPRTWKTNVILKFKKVKFEPLKRNNWTEYMFGHKNFSVHVTPYKVIIFPPKIESPISPYHAKALSQQYALEIVPGLERLLEVKLSNKRTTIITVSRQHIVMLNDKVYDELKRIGFTNVKDDKGNVILELDHSDGNKHIESKDRYYGVHYIAKLNELIKQYVQSDLSFDDMKTLLLTNQKAILKLKDESKPVFNEALQNKIPDYIG